MIKNKKIHIKSVLHIFGTILLLVAPLIFKNYDFIRGGIILVSGIALYFSMVMLSEKDWMDIEALFSGVWISTIGLAQFRLLEYQKIWQYKTWVCMALGYFALVMGVEIGKYCIDKGNFSFIKNNRIIQKIRIRENRYFIICVITTIIGLLCFVYSIYYMGSIPILSSDPSAYAMFHSKVHIFSIAATMVSGLCYYCIKKQDLKVSKKVVLWLCIIYNLFIFPIMIVSRGNFIISTVTFSAVVFYLNKKKLWVLLLCLAVMFSVYVGSSFLRNYTAEYLSYVFEPKTIYVNKDKDNTKVDINDNDKKDNEANDDKQNGLKIELSTKQAFLYSYLTSSHDNFNEAVLNAKNYTYGLRQLNAFNILLQIDALEEAAKDFEVYLVKQELNQANLFADAYYDLGVLGVILFPLLWGIAFGIIQVLYKKTNNIFLLIVLGNALIPVVLSFFSVWMSGYIIWVRWGTVFLLFLSSLTFKGAFKNKSSRRLEQ